MSLSIDSFGINPRTQSSSQSCFPAKGHLGGKSVVVVDSSYLHKQDVKAGTGLGDTLLKTFFVGAWLFASIIATFAVGIATASLSSAAITAGIMIGIPLGLLLGYDIGSDIKQRFSSTN